VQQFEKLFQFAQRVENLLYTISPEEVPFQLGFSKMDLRKILKTSLAGVKFYFHSYCCLLETARALNFEGVNIHKKVLLHISDTHKCVDWDRWRKFYKDCTSVCKNT
jgi:hypothetical protein